jgi:hypothetical protein
MKNNSLMKAALMLIINDFPAYGIISGWSTNRKLACPYYIENNKAFTLINDSKMSFFLLSPTVLANGLQLHKEQKGLLYW